MLYPQSKTWGHCDREALENRRAVLEKSSTAVKIGLIKFQNMEGIMQKMEEEGRKRESRGEVSKTDP